MFAVVIKSNIAVSNSNIAVVVAAIVCFFLSFFLSFFACLFVLFVCLLSVVVALVLLYRFLLLCSTVGILVHRWCRWVGPIVGVIIAAVVVGTIDY